MDTAPGECASKGHFLVACAPRNTCCVACRGDSHGMAKFQTQFGTTARLKADGPSTASNVREKFPGWFCVPRLGEAAGLTFNPDRVNLLLRSNVPYFPSSNARSHTISSLPGIEFAYNS